MLICGLNSLDAMQILTRFASASVGRSVVAFVIAAVSGSLQAQQLPQPEVYLAENDTVPVSLTLTKECGESRNYALANLSAQTYGWCRDAATRLDGTIEPTPALAGRMLTVSFDIDTANMPGFSVQLFVMTFDAEWTPLTQTRTSSITRGRMEIGLYVPSNARHIGLTLSGTGEAREGVYIRHVTARAGNSTVEPGTMCATCKAYLDGALEQVRKRFLFVERMSMDKIMSALRLNATGAESVADMDDVLKQLAERMNDAERAAGAHPHSHFLTRVERQTMSAPVAAEGTEEVACKDKPAPPDLSSYFDARLLNEKVGYIRLRGFLSQDGTQSRTFANGLLAEVARLKRQGAHRWVIDLRAHTGGNMWPALAGLQPLLGMGNLGYLVNTAGQKIEAWNYASANGSAGAPLVAGPVLDLDAMEDSIAVLFGAKTGSSGEMLAISFQGRDHTRSFGAPTLGATTSVYSVPDPYGNTLGIAWTYVADRKGRKIYPRVLPDVQVASDAHGGATLDAALTWLTTQP
jgi:carboxyl-terminal processing protease